MIDSSDDRLLQNILLDAAAEEYIAELASTEDVTTSPRFQRQMKKMLANPNSWAKQRKRPLWKQCLSRIAMLLIWLDDQKKINFLIDGFYDKDELLKMAESIVLCNVTKW